MAFSPLRRIIDAGQRMLPRREPAASSNRPWYRRPLPLILGVSLVFSGVGGIALGNSFHAGATTETPSPVESTTQETPKSALDLLDRLAVVQSQGQKSGFSAGRFRFLEDTDHNGCDTRNDVLRRDMASIVFQAGSGCIVVSGNLTSPYSGNTYLNINADKIAIDHVVSLFDAWQTGADGWDDARRVEFANDPLNLVAVEQALHGEKAGADAATWLPPRTSYRCEYVARQITVKAKYGLWVKPAEREVMTRVLSSCEGQKAFGESLWPPLGAGSAPSAAPSSATPVAPAQTKAPAKTTSTKTTSTKTTKTTKAPAKTTSTKKPVATKTASAKPSAKPTKTTTKPVTPTKTATTTRPSTTRPPTVPVVSYGSACSVKGQRAVTASGWSVVCKKIGGSLRWGIG